jgi:hypothetical protein
MKNKTSSVIIKKEILGTSLAELLEIIQDIDLLED